MRSSDAKTIVPHVYREGQGAGGGMGVTWRKRCWLAAPMPCSTYISAMVLLSSLRYSSRVVDCYGSGDHVFHHFSTSTNLQATWLATGCPLQSMRDEPRCKDIAVKRYRPKCLVTLKGWCQHVITARQTYCRFLDLSGHQRLLYCLSWSRCQIFIYTYSARKYRSKSARAMGQLLPLPPSNAWLVV